MSELTSTYTIALSFDQHPISIVRDDAGEPWWFADEVCAALGIADHKSSIRLLDPDEKGVHTVHTPGGPQQKAVINESGLYSLILRSRKPEAKRFKRWVTHEVLPSIRKTGTYATPTTLATREADLSALTDVVSSLVPALTAITTTLAAITDRLDALERRAAPPAPALPAPRGTMTPEAALEVLRRSGSGHPSHGNTKVPYLAFDPDELERLGIGRSVLHELAARGWLLPDPSDGDRDGRLFRRVSVGGIRKRMVCLRRDLFEALPAPDWPGLTPNDRTHLRVLIQQGVRVMGSTAIPEHVPYVTTDHGGRMILWLNRELWGIYCATGQPPTAVAA